jgi:uncharacterized protein YkwD
MKNYFILSAILWLSSCSFAQNLVVRSKSVTPSVMLPNATGNFRNDMLNMVNAVREQGCKCGSKKMPAVAPLTWNERLENASIAHAQDMSKHNHFDHVGTDGSEIDTRANRAGYKWMQIGENIAWGYDNIKDAMIGWIKSPSHCLQLMSNKVTEMGAARNNQYWVQDFGKQRTW